MNTERSSEANDKGQRNLITEIIEGFDALAEQQAGKRTLHAHVVEDGDSTETAAPSIDYPCGHP